MATTQFSNVVRYITIDGQKHPLSHISSDFGILKELINIGPTEAMLTVIVDEECSDHEIYLPNGITDLKFDFFNGRPKPITANEVSGYLLKCSCSKNGYSKFFLEINNNWRCDICGQWYTIEFNGREG